jgi:hypothetical protein
MENFRLTSPEARATGCIVPLREHPSDSDDQAARTPVVGILIGLSMWIPGIHSIITGLSFTIGSPV